MQVTVDGIPIDFEVRGAGTPVLLIHGWSCDRRYMQDDLEPVFADRPGWQRIYLDLPGHGKTPAPDWLATQTQMLEIVRGFIDVVVPDGRLERRKTRFLLRQTYDRRSGVGLVQDLRVKLLDLFDVFV